MQEPPEQPSGTGEGEPLNFADVDAAMLAAGLLEPMQVEGAPPETTATSTGEPAAAPAAAATPPPAPALEGRMRSSSMQSVAMPGTTPTAAAAMARGHGGHFGEEAYGDAHEELAHGHYSGAGGFGPPFGNAMDSAALLAEVQQQLATQSAGSGPLTNMLRSGSDGLAMGAGAAASEYPASADPSAGYGYATPCNSGTYTLCYARCTCSHHPSCVTCSQVLFDLTQAPVSCTCYLRSSASALVLEDQWPDQWLAPHLSFNLCPFHRCSAGRRAPRHADQASLAVDS